MPKIEEIKALEQQADVLFQNIAGWETSTLRRIGNRIKQTGEMSVGDRAALNNIAIVKQDMKEINRELAKVTGLNVRQLQAIYSGVIAAEHAANKYLFDYRNVKYIPFAENRRLQAIVKAYAKSTAETMINLANTKALYLRAPNGRFVKMQAGYLKILDKAVMQAGTGAETFHTAMRETIRQLGGGGVTVNYGSGVMRRLDTVIRQSLLWGAKQAGTAYSQMVGQELGCDGVEIDWHTNPRPTHEFIQGRQFVVGESRTINGEFWQGTDSIDPTSIDAMTPNDALNDYGCLHYTSPIICGVSEPRYSKAELETLNEQNAMEYTIDGKKYSGYDVTQMQRRLESATREQKTIRETAKAAGDDELAAQCTARILAYRDRYDELTRLTGIPQDLKRMSVTKARS